MLIQTSRFGPIDVAPDKIVLFERGLIGFPDAKRMVLLQSKETPGYHWLQCADDPGAAWVITDPKLHIPDYAAPANAEVLNALGMKDLKRDDPAVAGIQLSIIVNRAGDTLTGNLAAPVFMSSETMRGFQRVLPAMVDRVAHPLLTIPQAPPVSDDPVEVGVGSAGDPEEE